MDYILQNILAAFIILFMIVGIFMTIVSYNPCEDSDEPVE